MRTTRGPLTGPETERVAALQRAAYAVEAALIDDDRIPALRESADDIRSADLRWRFAEDSRGGLLAVAGTRRLSGADVPRRTGSPDEPGPPGRVELDRLVVHPGVHRHGVGSTLLAAVLCDAAALDDEVTVSTGRANAPALSLYRRFGFVALEDVEVVPGLWVQRLRWRQRRAVRVLCVDDVGHVLLLRWQDPVTGALVDEPPGGGVEPGESDLQAARRELLEEVGLDVDTLVGPVTVDRDQLWAGRRHVAVERFFVAQVRGVRPRLWQTGLMPDELPTARGYRWVSPKGLQEGPTGAHAREPRTTCPADESTREVRTTGGAALEPPCLAAVLRNLLDRLAGGGSA